MYLKDLLYSAFPIWMNKIIRYHAKKKSRAKKAFRKWEIQEKNGKKRTWKVSLKCTGDDN